MTAVAGLGGGGGAVHAQAAQVDAGGAQVHRAPAGAGVCRQRVVAVRGGHHQLVVHAPARRVDRRAVQIGVVAALAAAARRRHHQQIGAFEGRDGLLQGAAAVVRGPGQQHHAHIGPVALGQAVQGLGGRGHGQPTVCAGDLGEVQAGLGGEAGAGHILVVGGHRDPRGAQGHEVQGEHVDDQLRAVHQHAHEAGTDQQQREIAIARIEEHQPRQRDQARAADDRLPVGQPHGDPGEQEGPGNGDPF